MLQECRNPRETIERDLFGVMNHLLNCLALVALVAIIAPGAAQARWIARWQRSHAPLTNYLGFAERRLGGAANEVPTSVPGCCVTVACYVNAVRIASTWLWISVNTRS